METLPDPFGPLPTDPAEAESEQALRLRLREPRYARIVASTPGDGTVRSLAICAAAAVWGAGGPEGIARRRAAAFDGIPPSLAAGRRLAFSAPEGQPVPGEWVGTPDGNAEVLGWDSARSEALVRLLAQPRWLWVRADKLTAPVTRPGVARRKPDGGRR